MKFIHPLILAAGLLLLCSCTVFDTKHSDQASMVSSKPMVLLADKNWQVIKEAPKLRNERDRLPFQMEQSVQPEGTTKPVSPEEKRKIETTR